MKNFHSIIFLLLWIVVFTSCKKLLDKPPKDALTDKEMGFSATEMKLYSNQFYGSLPGWRAGPDYSTGIFGYDNSSDNMVNGNYANNARLAGLLTVPPSGGGWDWGNIRAVNYFLANYHVTTEPAAIVNTYIGEMYFWRAWFYYGLFQQFGQLPWYSRPLTPNDLELLQSPRLPRNQVADSMLADLDKAIELLSPVGVAEPLRINKSAALAFKSRVALYEGTWEKYQAGTPFGVTDADPNKYFRQVVSAAEALIATDKHSIPPFQATPRWNYWRLFNQKDLSSNTEMILWKKFDKSLGLTHFGQNNLSYHGDNTGISKQLVDAYLAIDGKPVSISPLYMGDDSIARLIRNRDPRLEQTILVRGHPRYIVDGDTTKFNEPAINLAAGQRNTTGYQLFKGAAPDDADGSGSVTASIAFRYAEVLLNYAEAKAELGEATQAVLDASINKLRARVGMPSLLVTVGFTDPAWEFPTLSPLLNEIRRERRVELALEGFRFDDLMRWRAHHLIKRPLYGAKYQQFVGKTFNPPLPDIPVSGDGYIYPLKNTPAAGGWQFNENKNYLAPLPTSELTLNPNLKQNPNY